MTGRGRFVLTAGAAAAGVMAYAARSPRSTLLAPSVFRGASTRRSLALTFDDGPSESTQAVLDLLDGYGVKATFFQCGANVRRLPEMARRVAEAGHEVGNHGDTHAALYLRRSGFIYNELERAQRAILEGTGRLPRYFRAPFGVRWFGLRESQQRLGLTGVMWTAIGLDWKRPEDRIVQRLLASAGNGAILVLHDGRELMAAPDIQNTLGALARLLPVLTGQGFHFETISEILCPTT